jgi:hypothetical protein
MTEERWLSPAECEELAEAWEEEALRCRTPLCRENAEAWAMFYWLRALVTEAGHWPRGGDA